MGAFSTSIHSDTAVDYSLPTIGLDDGGALRAPLRLPNLAKTNLTGEWGIRHAFSVTVESDPKESVCATQ